MSYIPLHVHSIYSLCRGTASMTDLIEAALRWRFPAMALTDSGNLYGAISFYQSARESGIKPILGAHVRVGVGSAVLLARNPAGYANLCRLITRAHGVSVPVTGPGQSAMATGDEWPRPLSAQEIAACQEGLFILADTAEVLEALLPAVSSGQLAAEVVRPGRSARGAERSLVELASRHGVRLVGSTAAMFLTPEDIDLHRTLTAIRKGVLATHLSPEVLSLPGHFLCGPEDFGRRFSDLPQAVRGTLEIAGECDLALPLGRPIFPSLSTPASEAAALERAALAGVRCRYACPAPAVMTRLRHELEVIRRLGFSGYFLVVADIVDFARGRGIPSVGRGSGASSLVSYALGITNVDPVRYNIHFERFLNLSRSDCPDIDVDFCWRRRDEVIEYVFRKHGPAHTAMISTHHAFRGRGAFHEVARAWGVSPNDARRLGERLPSDSSIPVEAVVRAVPDSVDVSEATLRRVVAQARRIVGFPRHLSVHCGGVVISPGPIDACVPLQRAAKGVVITQFEMNAIEDVGLVKIDLLGNRALSTIGEALRLVEAHRGVRMRPEEIPEDDSATFDLVRRGLTLGCNQLESPAMRNLLQMCAPRRVGDVIAALALVRPGAAGEGMKEEYVRRARGLSPVTFPHVSVEDVLRDSLGVMLYEDDAMVVSSRMAAWSLEEGDRFRKALRKARAAGDREALAGEFVAQCGRNGVPPAAARAAWAQLAKFAAYSFCKSHACGYGQMAYQAAYLKAHFPAEFMAAVLNHHGGMYARAVHVEEAKRLGLRVLLPCVNRSEMAFTAESGRLRTGLSAVKGLSSNTARDIVNERARGGLFGSLNDFLSRSPASRAEVESLVLCGALDCMGRSRPEMLWETRLTFETEQRARASPRLFRGHFHALRRPRLKDFDVVTRLEHELEVLELSAGPHVLRVLRPRIHAGELLDSRAIRGRIGRSIRLLGMLDATRAVEIAGGGDMEFLTFEDEHGLWECVLFPDAYRRCGGRIGPWGPYLIEGRVQEQYGAVTIQATGVRIVAATERRHGEVSGRWGVTRPPLIFLCRERPLDGPEGRFVRVKPVSFLLHSKLAIAFPLTIEIDGSEGEHGLGTVR